GMRTHPAKVFLASIVAVALIVAAACTGGTPATTPSPEPTATAAQQSSTPRVEATSNDRVLAASPTTVQGQPASVTALPAPIAVDAGNAEEIVAAQEAVLNGVYERSVPSIVNITVAQRAAVGDFGSQGGAVPRGEGSGFVWDDSGHIVTNNHVVAGADIVQVRFFDGTEVIAEVVGTDPGSDLAVVKVDLPKERLKPIQVGDSARVKVGQLAIAIGHPFGRNFTMTSGIVSAVGRVIPSGATAFSIPEAIQTDAPINPGNSGGPLLDREGRVVGVNSQIESQTGANVGIGYAVPINIVRTVVPALIKAGNFQYAYLGVELTSMTQEIARLMDLPQDTRGALIARVVRDGPADQAGLRGATREARTRLGVNAAIGGDVITKLGDTVIRSDGDLISFISLKARPGDRVKATIIRDGKTMEIEVKLGTRPT
ncbi:MAG: trypsin-like peptidase domain-containing protein, partial [Chloroflexi bacterium]|nr:trypsin-like peptidase domain-containing protein [Chloroflexota bacterium]